MNEMAEYPEMRDSFFEILLLSTFSRGTRSASTKFCAKELTSTPEPAFNDVMIFWAFARFAAASDAALVAVLFALLAGVADETEEVAMGECQKSKRSMH
jgi:hypothetical protein